MIKNIKKSAFEGREERERGMEISPGPAGLCAVFPDFLGTVSATKRLVRMNVLFLFSPQCPRQCGWEGVWALRPAARVPAPLGAAPPLG